MYYKQSLIWNKKPKTKVQNSPIDKAETRAWMWFSKYIRMRDCIGTTGTKEMFKCVSCGGLTHFSKGDAGHFITRSSKATKFDERNVYAQCQRCNRFQQGAWDRMYEHILKVHGQGVIDELLRKKHEIAHIDYSELSDRYRILYNSIK